MKCTERYIAEQNQLEFKLSSQIMGDDVLVYLNGALVDPGEENYYLLDIPNNSVIFNNPLTKGDSVVIEQGINRTSNNIIGYNSTNSNSLFYKYGSVEKLFNNNKYTITIPLINKDIDKIEWSFSTILSPFITKIKTIRIDTGELFEHVSDETIANVIYANSQEVVELYQEYIESDEYTGTATTVDLTALPRFVRNWVRFKTDIDLIYAAYLTIMGKYGSIDKKIGYMEIENTVKKPDLEGMLSLFQKKFDLANEQLNPSETAVINMVKAGNTSYPIDARNSF